MFDEIDRELEAEEKKIDEENNNLNSI